MFVHDIDRCAQLHLFECEHQIARARLDVPPSARMMLIFGGSQAVRRFNAAVSEYMAQRLDGIVAPDRQRAAG